jgi:hypothetical protein
VERIQEDLPWITLPARASFSHAGRESSLASQPEPWSTILKVRSNPEKKPRLIITLLIPCQIISQSFPRLSINEARRDGKQNSQDARQLSCLESASSRSARDWLQLAELQAGVVGGIAQPSAASYSNSRAARGNGTALDISGNRAERSKSCFNSLMSSTSFSGSSSPAAFGSLLSPIWSSLGFIL